MRRYYTLGIIFMIIFLNVPEVRGDMQTRVTFYRPKIEDQVNQWSDQYKPVITKYTPALTSLTRTLLKSQTIIDGKLIDKTIDTPVDTNDDFSMNHKPSITAEQFDKILRDYNSPAAGIGSHVTKYAIDKNIDTAYVLYVFIHESTAGTNTQWIGNKGNGQTTHNPGNIICAGYSNCYSGFRDYDTWEDGFNAMIDLMVDMRDNRGKQDIDALITTWAPPNENDTNGYIASLKENVTKWRSINSNAQIIQTTNFSGNKHEVSDGMIIYGGFYAVSCDAWGFQSNCQHWGTDIHVDVDAPVYIPVECYYITTGHYSDPSHAGDYVMCTTYDGYEYYSGHLKNAIRLNAGDRIAPGTIIGYGCECVSGPHTHIQLRNSAGILTDFMQYYNER